MSRRVLADLRQRVQIGLLEKTETRTLVLPSALMDHFRHLAKQHESDGQPPRSEDDELEMWIVDQALAEHLQDSTSEQKHS